MKKSFYRKTVGVAALTFLLGAGCEVRTAYRGPAVGVGVDVDTEPPAPLVETVPASPDPAFVWIGGAWIWGGGGWHWQGGHYERPPHPGAIWVPHRYENRNGRRVFVRGGWR